MFKWLLAGLLVVLLILLLNGNKSDGYHVSHNCQSKCSKITGHYQRQACVDKCAGDKVLQYGGQKCSSTRDCGYDQVCVLGGAYGGFEKGGVCMDQSEPGSLRWSREEYGQQQSCNPGDYFNFLANECQPIYQGSSSAYSVMHKKPVPPVNVTIPGTTLPGYGVGMGDPYNVLTNVTVS